MALPGLRGQNANPPGALHGGWRKRLHAAAGPLRAAVKPLRAAAKPLRVLTKPLRVVAKPLRAATEPLRATAKPLRSAGRWLRAVWRGLRVLGHIASGLATIALRFPRLAPEQQNARVQLWAMELLALLHIQLAIRGQPPLTGPVLLVANHISWLDIPVLHAARHCRFVSKADVRGWPLLGRLASAAGTLYIHRESRRDALRMVHAMEHALGRREVLAVFPEGTTGDGISLLPFHPNLLQAAITSGAPVQPVGLRFADRASGATSLAPSYVGRQTLIGSIWRTLCAPPLQALVHYGQPEHANGRDRRSWTRDLEDTVERLRRD